MTMPSSLQAASNQRGVALIVGLILLLVLTIIGVVAIKSSTQQERMSASYQQQALTFQGAESLLRMTVSWLNNNAGANLPAGTPDLLTQSVAIAPATLLTPVTATPTPDGGAANTPAGSIQLVGDTYNQAVAASTTTVANFYHTGTGGISPGMDIGKFTAFAFDVNAVSFHPPTGSRSNNILGISYIAPKQAAN